MPAFRRVTGTASGEEHVWPEQC